MMAVAVILVAIVNTVQNKKPDISKFVIGAVLAGLGVAGNVMPAFIMFKRVVKIPVVTYGLIADGSLAQTPGAAQR